MLLLQRKAGEQIRIGDDVVVTVIRTANGKVRLGIEAPQRCPVRRSELPALDDAAAAEDETVRVA